jgi:hypothetical protein
VQGDRVLKDYQGKLFNGLNDQASFAGAVFVDP